jgi:hypothetical protein
MQSYQTRRRHAAADIPVIAAGVYARALKLKEASL